MGYLALAGLLGGWTAVLTLKACEGEMIPPLDDTYIYLQYGKAAGLGEPMVYQPGAPPTRGATSLLYPLLLGPPSRILAPGQLIWAAWLMGVLCLAGSALAADRWAARRLGSGAAWITGILVLLSGHYLWGAVSGMDIVLYGLSLATALALVPWYLEAPSPESGLRRLAVLAGVLWVVAMARPEGVLLAGVVAVLVPLARRAPNSARARWILILAPITAFGITAMVNLSAIGELGGNTLTAKSIWSEPRPDVRAQMIGNLPQVLLRVTRALFSDFFSRAFGFGTRHLLEALLSLGALAGAGMAFFRTRNASDRILVTVILAALLTAVIPAGPGSHHFRYQMPYVPIATMLVVFGWWRLFPPRARLARLLPLALIATLLLPGLWRFGHMVARNASNIRDHQVAVGRWVHENLPEDAVVGINDAGAIAYYGERRIVDLVGLVTNGSALPKRAGPGSLFEWLETLPAWQRPTHFAIFPDWFPYLKKTSLVGGKLVQFVLGVNTISGADLKAVYLADWSHVGCANPLWVRRDLLDLWGFSVVDRVDVGDLENQDAHHYESFDTWRDTLREFQVSGKRDLVLIEGGRQSSRGERFRMQCRPGEPAALVMRTEAFREFELEVKVDGRRIGTWVIPRAPMVWTEPLFEIPGDALTSETVLVELTRIESGIGFRYPSFHYWLLQ